MTMGLRLDPPTLWGPIFGWAIGFWHKVSSKRMIPVSKLCWTTIHIPSDKPASLSTVSGTKTAGKAVDGIYIPEPPLIEYENVAHSQLESNPWWRVDLQDIRCIIAVNILNRSSKCTERLLVVFVCYTNKILQKQSILIDFDASRSSPIEEWNNHGCYEWGRHFQQRPGVWTMDRIFGQRLHFDSVLHCYQGQICTDTS